MFIEVKMNTEKMRKDAGEPGKKLDDYDFHFLQFAIAVTKMMLDGGATRKQAVPDLQTFLQLRSAFFSGMSLCLEAVADDPKNAVEIVESFNTFQARSDAFIKVLKSKKFH